ncbi:hypothetical protein A2U01_0110123, partial [Trifolium medium]|nr:hypothetical protein [Trifolium medium]
FITSLDEFWGGFALKPPQSTLFCVLSPGEVLVSPGAVLEVARRGAGEDVTSCRQMSLAEAKHSANESLPV